MESVQQRLRDGQRSHGDIEDQVPAVGHGAQPGALDQELRLSVRQVGGFHRCQVPDDGNESTGGHLLKDRIDADGEVPGLVDACGAQHSWLVGSGQAAGQHCLPVAWHALGLLVHRRHQQALLPAPFRLPDPHSAPSCICPA
jgi:hypothetical protein